MKAREAAAAMNAAEAAAAMKVLRARPPADEKDRIAAAIAVIRSGRHCQENDYPVENALRELVRIGKPAVPDSSKSSTGSKATSSYGPWGSCSAASATRGPCRP